MISAGILDQKVIPLYPVYSGRSSLGAQTVTWNELTARAARVVYLKGKKVLDTGETFLDQDISVTIRYTSVVTERCRLKWQDRTYEIVSLNGSLREGALTIKARRIDEGNEDAETTE